MSAAAGGGVMSSPRRWPSLAFQANTREMFDDPLGQGWAEMCRRERRVISEFALGYPRMCEWDRFRDSERKKISAAVVRLARWADPDFSTPLKGDRNEALEPSAGKAR